MTETNFPINKVTMSVRPSMLNGRGHSLERRSVNLRAVTIEYAANATHIAGRTYQELLRRKSFARLDMKDASQLLPLLGP